MQSSLVPFLRKNLDILFVGLNPAKGSSVNRHYFSVNQSFWNQLFDSGLIKQYVDKSVADTIVFGSTSINRNNWSYGITDLVTRIAESDSTKIHPTQSDCERLHNSIIKFEPRVVVLLHGKVLDNYLPYLGKPIPISNSGKMGNLIKNHKTMFFNIAFPHGNTIPSIEKVKHYKRIIEYLDGN